MEEVSKLEHSLVENILLEAQREKVKVHKT